MQNTLKKLIKLINFKKPSQQKTYMQTFSEEKLGQLLDELQLNILTTNQINQNINRTLREHTQEVIVGALSQLRVEKILLQSKINALTDYLKWT